MRGVIKSCRYALRPTARTKENTFVRAIKTRRFIAANETTGNNESWGQSWKQGRLAKCVLSIDARSCRNDRGRFLSVVVIRLRAKFIFAVNGWIGSREQMSGCRDACARCFFTVLLFT